MVLMKTYPNDQNFVVRSAIWYLRDFPLARGKGHVNRLLGKFLEIRLFGDVRLRLTNPLEFHQRLLLYDGAASYEPEVSHVLDTLLEPGMVFVDVGANLGYYSMIASRKVGERGHVHAFEPVAEQCDHLLLNARVNRARNVKVNRCAVADSVGEREFFLSDTWNRGVHSLARTVGQTRSCRVPCVTLDEYVARNGVSRIDVMKVDVEGAEAVVFDGARETFAAMPPSVVIFESCEEHAKAFGSSTTQPKRFLLDRGYELFHLESASRISPVPDLCTETFANILAVHESERDRVLAALSGSLVAD